MKFGKQLHTVVNSCDEEWRSYWMDYSKLKKLIKEITKKNPPQNATHANAKENVFIVKSPDEIKFFKELKNQLESASQFFDKKSKEMRERKNGLMQEYDGLERKAELTTEAERLAFMKKVAEYYKELLLFESFGVFNFYGFSKILKKHDRWTGYKTKEKFMENQVGTHAFVSQQYLTELLDDTRLLYERATALSHRFKQADGGKQEDEGKKADYVQELEQAKNQVASMLCSLKKRSRPAEDDSEKCSSTEENSISPRKKKQTTDIIRLNSATSLS